MAADSLRARHPKRRINIISLRKVYQSVWNHPFVAVMLLFLLCLHQYFPSAFALVVSVSPIIICTAVLLGAILVHGQPNDHRVECHGGLGGTISSQRTGVADHLSSAERDRIFSNNRFAEVRNSIVAKNTEVSGMVGAGIKVIDNLAERVDWEYCNSKLCQGKSKAGFHFGQFEDNDFQMPEIQAQNLVGKHDRMLQVNADAGMVDKLDNKLDTFVYQYNHVNAAAHHDSSVFESDGRGKPFVNDFVVHSVPTSQEIHPVLDTEDLPLHNLSHDASPKFEMQSLESNVSDAESDEEVDYIIEEAEDEVDDDDDEDETPEAKNGGERSAVAWTEDDQKVLLDLTCSEMEKNDQFESLMARISNEINDRQLAEETGVSEEEEDDDDDDDDDDDGGNYQHMEKDGNKPVTLWTEEDEKNLRALGTSELERNLRLENLLARRRVQRNFSMILERNLIDLDLSDLPVQVAPISTNRVNPFDNTSRDTDPRDNVPPIPGSAPSIALRRKNPFDSPSTSPKRADNPIEDCPEEESMDTDLKNPVFHTQASSSTDYNRIEDVLEPKFMERGEKEASLRRYESFSLGYDFMVDPSSSGQDFWEVDRRNAAFSRHESFSVRPAFSSIFTREKPNRRQWRPIFVPKQLAGEEVMHPSLEKQSSQDSGSAVSSGSDSESFSSHEDYEHIGSNEEESSTSELHQNGEERTTANHFPSDSESGSEYSEAVEDDEDEHLAVNVSVRADIEYQKTLASGENFDTASSTSMSSKEDDGSSSGCQFQEVDVDESVFSPKAPLAESDIKHMSTKENHKEIEPIYDESPSAMVKNRAFS